MNRHELGYQVATILFCLLAAIAIAQFHNLSAWLDIVVLP